MTPPKGAPNVGSHGTQGCHLPHLRRGSAQPLCADGADHRHGTRRGRPGPGDPAAPIPLLRHGRALASNRRRWVPGRVGPLHLHADARGVHAADLTGAGHLRDHHAQPPGHGQGRQGRHSPRPRHVFSLGSRIARLRRPRALGHLRARRAHAALTAIDYWWFLRFNASVEISTKATGKRDRRW